MADSTIFTGSSRYSNDFQSVIQRSVAIASLPMSQLQSQKQTLQNQSSAVSGLKTQFDSLKTSLQNLTNVTKTRPLTSSSSTSTVATVRTEAKALPGSYQLEVVSLGSSTNAMSSAGGTTVSDPVTQNIGSSGAFTLTVNGKQTELTLGTNSLSGLADAINALPDGDVRATIINMGGSGAPDYRLAVRGKNLAADTISLQQNGTDLLDTVSTGSNGSVRINGNPTPVPINSNKLTLAPGITATISSVGTTNLSVDRDDSSVSGALTSLVNAYNNASAEVDKQRGKGGVLAGQSVISTLSQSLRGLATTTVDGGTISSLTELGISFTREGKLSFDATVFQERMSKDRPGVEAFLNGTGDNGFLNAAGKIMDQLSGENGVLPATDASLTKSMSHQDELIADSEERIERLRDSLTQQLNAADASIAMLEQQVKYVNGLFSGFGSQNN